MKDATAVVTAGLRKRDVSIHASVKDATQINILVMSCRGFNPRVREGRDCRGVIYVMRRWGFNPRVREGRDFWLPEDTVQSSSFNPRVREGRDKMHNPLLLLQPVSIHASVKDATRRGTALGLPLTMFQSTRP